MNSPSPKPQLAITSPGVHNLKGLWQWWIGELAGLLPQSIRSAARPRVERLYLLAQDDRIVASQGSHGKVEKVADYPLGIAPLPDSDTSTIKELVERSREVILYLPAGKVLIKPVKLPLATEGNLREVLGFEMDRQTPFSLDQVYYDHFLRKRDSKTNSIDVDLVVTPRAYLDQMLTTLDDMGFSVHKVVPQPVDGEQALPINLLPEQRRQRRRDSARHLNIILSLLAVLLLAATIALPLINKGRVIESLEARAELMARKAGVIQRLQEEVEQLTMDSGFLAKKKQLTPLTLEIIDELTRVLPDDTWINRLSIKGKEVQIQGYSNSAANLIPLIESSDRLHNPRFRSSVTTARDSESERFHLSAEITGRDQP